MHSVSVEFNVNINIEIIDITVITPRPLRPASIEQVKPGDLTATTKKERKGSINHKPNQSLLRCLAFCVIPLKLFFFSAPRRDSH